MSRHRHDAIVIGAGHNGLVTAAYLARAGLDTVLLERRDSVGGCASTVPALGGRVNICNCDHLWIRATPIAEELELERHGLGYLELDPSYLALGWAEEQPWLHYHDLEQTLEGLAATHPGSVDGYRRHVRELMPLARLVREVTNGVPTPARVGRLAAPHPRASGRLLRLARRSAVDVLRRYFDDEELIRPALTVGPVVWGVDPSWPGTGLAALAYVSKHLIPVGRPAGGSGALTDAIHSAFTAAGGVTRLGSTVVAAEPGPDGSHRISLADGTDLSAERVVMSADPRAMHGWSSDRLSWLAADEAEPEGYESKVDAFLTEPPRYRALDRLPHPEDAAHATVLVSPTLDELGRAHRALQRGELSPHLSLITNTPSTLDPSLQDAEGNHLLSLEVLWTPFSGADWTDDVVPQGWIQRWSGLIEQPLEAIWDRHRTMTPDRYAGEFSMIQGHAPSFAGTPWSAVRGRPRHLTRYRTPVEGLYLGGAATYPGAGIWGAPGRNAASVVLRDASVRRRARWSGRFPSPRPGARSTRGS